MLTPPITDVPPYVLAVRVWRDPDVFDFISICCWIPIGTISAGGCWISDVNSWRRISADDWDVVDGASGGADTVNNSIVWQIPGKSNLDLKNLF